MGYKLENFLSISKTDIFLLLGSQSLAIMQFFANQFPSKKDKFGGTTPNAVNQ